MYGMYLMNYYLILVTVKNIKQNIHHNLFDKNRPYYWDTLFNN